MDMSVLVVDDSRTMTEIICKSLQEIGFTDIDRAHNGASALGHLRAKRYGLGLSDWEMQPMNGPQLIDRMRNDLSISNIPVILVTAKHDQDHSWLAGGETATSSNPSPFICFARRSKRSWLNTEPCLILQHEN
jgi:two-component system chemotaxis response regulator CheY